MYLEMRLEKLSVKKAAGSIVIEKYSMPFKKEITICLLLGNSHRIRNPWSLFGDGGGDDGRDTQQK